MSDNRPEAKVVVYDAEYARGVAGRPIVTRQAGLIRVAVQQRDRAGVEVMATAHNGYLQMSPAGWRLAIQDIQGLLCVPDDRGPGESDQAGEPWEHDEHGGEG